MLDRTEQVDQGPAEPVDGPGHYDVEPPPARILEHGIEARALVATLGAAGPHRCTSRRPANPGVQQRPAGLRAGERRFAGRSRRARRARRALSCWPRSVPLLEILAGVNVEWKWPLSRDNRATLLQGFSVWGQFAKSARGLPG